MAQEQHEIRSINWNELFAFTHLFKCFRMAIQPSKLLLAAGALAVLFLIGWGMDRLWGLTGSTVLVAVPEKQAPPNGQPGEIYQFSVSSGTSFGLWRQDRLSALREQFARLLSAQEAARENLGDFTFTWLEERKKTANPDDRQDLTNALTARRMKETGPGPRSLDTILKDANQKNLGWMDLRNQFNDVFAEEVSRIRRLLGEAEEDARKDVSGIGESNRPAALDALARHRAAAERALTVMRAEHEKIVLFVAGEGISEAFTSYEWNCLRGAIQAAAHGNFVSRLDQYKQMARQRGDVPYKGQESASLQPLWADPDAPQGVGGPGALVYLLLAWQGLMWLIQTHYWYALVYLVLALAVTAFFGGAVNRMAALHFAREEKISAVQALKFSAEKFLNFFVAPLLPIAILFVLGGIIALGSFALLNWPIADWFGGLFFILAILVGVAIAFLLVGLVGGVWLMYPTIAAEGSDSFDAISRSFSYVYARPWRTILYGAISSVYGAITYLFVRLFVFLALSATHWFAKLGVASWFGGRSLSPEADRLDLIWQAPTFDNLWGSFNWAAMDRWDMVPAFLIGAWVFLLACVVAGYLLSYAASATTVIYFLLRRKVDATDLDDVYVEEAPLDTESPAGEAAAASPGAAPAAGATPPTPPGAAPPTGGTAPAP